MHADRLHTDAAKGVRQLVDLYVQREAGIAGVRIGGVAIRHVIALAAELRGGQALVLAGEYLHRDDGRHPHRPAMHRQIAVAVEQGAFDIEDDLRPAADIGRAEQGGAGPYHHGVRRGGIDREVEGFSVTESVACAGADHTDTRITGPCLRPSQDQPERSMPSLRSVRHGHDRGAVRLAERGGREDGAVHLQLDCLDRGGRHDPAMDFDIEAAMNEPAADGRIDLDQDWRRRCIRRPLSPLLVISRRLVSGIGGRYRRAGDRGHGQCVAGFGRDMSPSGRGLVLGA